VSYKIEDVLDKLKEIKGPQDKFFVTNDKSHVIASGGFKENSISIAEKSLISNLRKGMSLP